MRISGHTANNPHAVVPWAALSKSPDSFIEPKYLPDGVELQEISKMKGGPLNRCIQHWLERAETGDIPLRFKAVHDSHRRDGKGKKKRKQPARDDGDEDDSNDSHQQDPKGKKKRRETPSDDEDEDEEDSHWPHPAQRNRIPQGPGGDKEDEGDEARQDGPHSDDNNTKGAGDGQPNKKQPHLPSKDIARSPTLTDDGPPGDADQVASSGGAEAPSPMWYNIIIPHFMYSKLTGPSSSPADVLKQLPNQLAFLLSLSRESDYLALVKMASTVPVS